MTTEKIQNVFGKTDGILIGMIHLPPLKSLQGYPGDQLVIEKALADLRALEAAGFDGALLENENDKPHTEFANTEQIECITAVAKAVRGGARIPFGVQLLLNDWKASFDVARETRASFTRLDVFVDHVACEWGEIDPDPAEIIAYKNRACPALLLFTDIQVKYKTMVHPRPLSASAELAIRYGSDGLIVTGAATGAETPLEKIKEIRNAFPDAFMLIGAGVDKTNIKSQLALANGAIIGTSVKTGEYVDVSKARALKTELTKDH